MADYQVICQHCQTETDPRIPLRVCPTCTGPLGIKYNYTRARLERPGTRSLWRFADLLPVQDPDRAVTLGEGGTALIRSTQHPDFQVYYKDERSNPTGSQKDRALSVAVTKAREFAVPAVMVVSTGSVALACAAYSSRAGIPGGVVMPLATPVDRLFPVSALGAHVFLVHGSVEDSIDVLREACVEHGIYEASTYRRGNPYQSEGIKTIGFEIFLDLGRVPDWIVVPVGGGGTIAAIWRAFVELRLMDRIDRMPRLVGIQPSHYNALEIAIERNLVTEDELNGIPFGEVPPTILVKLQHTVLPDGAEALAAIRDSHGLLVTVTDQEALDGQARLGKEDGLYAEPSSAVVVPAIERLIRDGQIQSGDVVVACLTGSGFRETSVSAAARPAHATTITREDGVGVLAAFAREHTDPRNYRTLAGRDGREKGALS